MDRADPAAASPPTGTVTCGGDPVVLPIADAKSRQAIEREKKASYFVLLGHIQEARRKSLDALDAVALVAGGLDQAQGAFALSDA